MTAESLTSDTTSAIRCGLTGSAGAISSMPGSGAAQLAGGIQTRLLIVAGLGVALALGIYLGAPLFMHDESAGQPVPIAIETKPVPDLAATRAKAEQGDAEAQKTLGAIYAKGMGVKEDYTEAAKWYRLAAEQGNAAAQNAMGELCEAGRGCPQSDAEAARWFRLAAEQGHTSAQYSLAVLFAVGKGVAQDDAEAVKWYFRAAERGDSLAQYNIGKRFVDGRGVKQDLVEAFKWLSLAKADGLPDAASALEQLLPRMTSEQTAEGKRRVEGFVMLKPTATGK